MPNLTETTPSEPTPEAARSEPPPARPPKVRTQLPTTEELVAVLTQTAVSSTNGQAFWRSALGALARGFGSPFATLEVQEHASLVRMDHSDGGNPDFWREGIQEVVEETLAEGPSLARLYRGKGTGVGVGLFAATLRKGAGAIGLAIPCRSPQQAERIQERLDSLTALIGVLASGVEHTGPLTAETQERASANANAMRRASDYESTVQLAMTVTNRLASREGYEQAAFARVRGNKVELLAVSGLDHIDKKSPGIGQLQQAMEEALDFGEAVVAQRADRDGEPEEDAHEDQPELQPLAEGRLHKAWHAEVGFVPVCSIPLSDDDGMAAVLSVRRRPGAPLDREEVEQLEKMVSPFARALPVVERANRGLLSHALASFLAAPVAFFSRNHIGRKLTYLALAAAAFWTVAGELTYRVGTVTTIQPRTTRALGAPIDGVLLESPFAPGDQVVAGFVLARFDTEQLELEANRLVSEITILEGEEKRAIAEGDPTAVQVGRSKRAELAASLDLIRLQIEQAFVRAPFNGTLVEGDLRERIGDTFQKGEPLYRVAGTDGHRLEILVDERDIDDIAIGQEGAFAAFARPEQKLPFRVNRIHPSASAEGDGNRYVVEAELLLSAGSLSWARPGMEGSGKIDVGQRSPAWIALHRVIDHARMLSWK